MRFHAVVHDKSGKSIFECQVQAKDEGEALRSVEDHMRKNTQEDIVKTSISLLQVRDDIATNLPLILSE